MGSGRTRLPADEARRADYGGGTARGIAYLLWLTALVTLPVPFFMIERGWVPVARLLVFAVATTVAAVSDPDYAAKMIAGMFALQTLFYGALLYAAARLVGRRLASISSPVLRRALVAAVLAGLVAVALTDAFVMPFSRSGSRGGIRQLLD